MSLDFPSVPNDSTYAMRGRWIVPLDRPPIEDGVIVVIRDKIKSITTYAQWQRGAPTALMKLQDCGDMAILPGLVNAHAHLELSDLQTPLGKPGMELADWIPLVVQHRRARNQSHQAEAWQRGWKESQESGTTLLGDIVQQGWQPLVNEQSVADLIPFQEVLAFTNEQAIQSVQAVQDFAAQFYASGLEALTPGISPHAPYTLRWDAFCGLIDWVVKQQTISAKQWPIAMHLGESPAERELLFDQNGPLVEMLKRAGVWDGAARPGQLTPLDYLQQLSRAHCALVIHGNDLRPNEIEFIAKHRDNISVVYCPRTHAFFGHAPHPFRAMQQQGITVALGTDSRASNPDLSLWNEIKFLVERGLASPTDALLMGTQAGARALGASDKIGRLAPGYRADFFIHDFAGSKLGVGHEEFFES